MALTLVTAPVAEPVTLAEAKAWCKVDHSDDDALITSLNVAARDRLEHETRRQFVTATWRLTLPRFSGPIRLPKPPFQSASSITYVDPAGATQTVTASWYTAAADPDGGLIVLGENYSWPDVLPNRVDAVTVQFVAGYGLAVSVPDAIKTAIKMTLAHWYAQREPVVIGSTTAEVPMSARWLLGPYRANLYAHAV